MPGQNKKRLIFGRVSYQFRYGHGHGRGSIGRVFRRMRPAPREQAVKERAAVHMNDALDPGVFGINRAVGHGFGRRPDRAFTLNTIFIRIKRGDQTIPRFTENAFSAGSGSADDKPVALRAKGKVSESYSVRVNPDQAKVVKFRARGVKFSEQRMPWSWSPRVFGMIFEIRSLP